MPWVKPRSSRTRLWRLLSLGWMSSTTGWRHHSVLRAEWVTPGQRLTCRHCDRGAGTERIYYGWDQYFSGAIAHYRSFLCMESNCPYAIKTQRKARNSPIRELWVSWAVSLWLQQHSDPIQSEHSIWMAQDQWEVTTLPEGLLD